MTKLRAGTLGRMTETYIRLRTLGYAPHRPTADGREFVGYPYPEGAGYGVAVREAGDPVTLTLERVPGEALDWLGVAEAVEAEFRDLWWGIAAPRIRMCSSRMSGTGNKC